MTRFLLNLLVSGALLASPLLAREFSAVTYNVENLFDLDGVANYTEYKPEKYTPEHLRVKVANIARILAKVDHGKGPDIIVLNEIEIDQTPASTPFDLPAWLQSVRGKTNAELLAQKPLPPDLADLPAEAWLLKALEEAGLTGYHVVSAAETPGLYEDGRPRSVQNLILSRFPVLASKVHRTPGARDIVEARIDIDGHPLIVFANHWKSGAGNPKNEESRILNAKTLRDRIDTLLKKDPLADILVAGDFNSHYNQKQRYPDFDTTGIADVLGSQGNEISLRTGKRDLYNLWFELPTRERGSDIYRDEWGTLMHMLLTRGLYDNSGLQYIDNSFQILRYPGLNSDVFGRPHRWSRGSRPGGFSDHFPILARFRVAPADAKAKWMTLKNPSSSEQGTARPIRLISSIDLFRTAIDPSKEPQDADFRDGTYDGRVFLIQAPATVNDKGWVSVNLNGQDYDVFTHDEELRKRIREHAKSGTALRFYGALGTFRGRWQFVLYGSEWLADKPSSTLRGNQVTRLALRPSSHQPL
jgi:endonuclease/exonuclease/phosphatase family metal-dependent hydrolase